MRACVYVLWDARGCVQRVEWAQTFVEMRVVCSKFKRGMVSDESNTHSATVVSGVDAVNAFQISIFVV